MNKFPGPLRVRDRECQLYSSAMRFNISSAELKYLPVFGWPGHRSLTRSTILLTREVSSGMVGSTSSDMARVAYRRDTNELAVDFSEETCRGRKEDIINNIHNIFQCLHLAAYQQEFQILVSDSPSFLHWLVMSLLMPHNKTNETQASRVFNSKYVCKSVKKSIALTILPQKVKGTIQKVCHSPRWEGGLTKKLKKCGIEDMGFELSHLKNNIVSRFALQSMYTL